MTAFQRPMSGFGAGSIPKAANTSLVQPSRMIGVRHLVDRGDVAGFDHRAFAHVAEKPDLAPLLARDLAIGAAEKDVRLNADRAQFLDRMLGRLGLEFAGAWNERQQREVNIDRVPARQFIAELADRLEKGRPSISPTVPPISTRTKSTPSLPLSTKALIALVTCGMTWTVAPR